jgi:hypothetical protein
MEQWEFTKDGAGRWSWRSVRDASRGASDRTFVSRTDCIADAMRNGYLDYRVADRSHHRKRNRTAGSLLDLVSARIARKPASA